MRILHLADLHFGKSIYGVSLLESGDQPHWVGSLLEKVEAIRPDAVVIAGDVYDRSAPSGDAVQLCSRMLTGLHRLGVPVMLVAGNHDSVQRLSFAGDMLSREGVHIAPDLFESKRLARVTLTDAWGDVDFWLMPYVFPALVERALGLEDLRDYDAAVRALLARQDVDFTRRNVLVAHQNVTANGAEAERGGSESMVGGVGQVDYTAFDGFDYVALGHIHAACQVGRDTVRYAGSPLCYHFDETRQRAKGPLLVEIGRKGAPVRIETIHIPPLHPLRRLRGAYEAIRDEAINSSGRNEYASVTLTDRRVGTEEADFLRELFESRGGKLLELTSEYMRDAGASGAPSSGTVERKRVDELFEDFYAQSLRGETPDDRTRALLRLAGEALSRADVHAAPDNDAVQSLLDALERGGAEL